MRFNNKPESVFFIGIAGGSCAGKTTFARRLRAALGMDFCQILSQDSYYRDQSEQFDFDGGAINFDHPSSIDFELLRKHLFQLQQGRPIQVPIYDFPTHRRLSKYITLYPTNVILLEGALILSQPKIAELLSESVFLDIPEPIRLQRRLHRDMTERARTREGVLAQFRNHVKPMHQQFIEPYKHLATYYITDESTVQTVIDNLIDKLGIDS